jgi:hypothetical protein
MVKITVRLYKLQKNGMVYQALLGKRVLFEGRDPEHGVCRVLFSSGIDSPVSFYKEGQEQPYIRGTCKEMAAHMIKELDKGGLSRVKYVEPDFSRLREMRNG